MGRRDADSGSRALTVSAAAWEAACRALGRLFTHASVRRLPEERLLAEARVPEPDVLASPEPSPGALESGWRPQACVPPSSLSRIEARLSEKESCPVAHPAGENHAFLLPVCHVMPLLRAIGLRVESVKVVESAKTVRLPDAFLALPPDPLRLRQTSLLPPLKTQSVGSLRRGTPGTKELRVPRPPAARIGPARTGEGVLSKVSLTRRGQEAPRGVPLPVAFAAEHRRLAETAGLPLADVTLLGIFPAVPIIAVRRLVVEEEGRLLRLWLKPESWWGRPPPRRITLLIGRQVSTGKMLQAAG